MVTKVSRCERSLWAALLVVCFFFGNQRIASAEHLGLPLKVPPDVYSLSVSLDYVYDSNSQTGVFTAEGYAWSLDLGDAGLPYWILDASTGLQGGRFRIHMLLDSEGVPVGGDGLTITGTVPDQGFSSGTLLKGSIIQFGFEDPPAAGPIGPAADIFEFVFAATDGDDLSPLYVGHKAYVNLFAKDSWFEGDFTDDFGNSGNILAVVSSHADTFATPEPTSFMVWSFLGPAGLAYGLYVWSRRRRQAMQDKCAE